MPLPVGWPFAPSALPLPSGAATAAGQAAQTTVLGTLATQATAASTLSAVTAGLDGYFQISRGLVPGLSGFGTAGLNRNVGIATVPEDVWVAGGLYPWQTSAQTLEAVSDDADDSAAGTGVRTVRIVGLNSSWAPITETITLNGTTPVTTVNQFLRVNLFVSLSCGSHGTNKGNITLRVAGAGATQATMLAGEGQSLKATYTVPAGFRALLLDAFVAIVRPGSAEQCEFAFKARTTVGNVTGPWITRNIFSVNAGGSSTIFIEPRLLGVLPEKTDIRFTVTSVTADNTTAQAVFIVVLEAL